jgi:Domain of unknown function (DUF4126)
MHLVFDIFQGMGVAAAVGIRPFLPALAVGGLAAGDAEIHFNHTAYSFLQSAPFLLAMAVLAIALAIVERRWQVERGFWVPVLGIAGAALGALLFAGSLCRGGYVVWPGFLGGVVCAAIAVAATVPLLRRARGRLDASAAGTLPVYAEAAAVLSAALSVVAPPLGLVLVLLLLWLLIAGRGQEEQKYAGLRILK